MAGAETAPNVLYQNLPTNSLLARARQSSDTEVNLAATDWHPADLLAALRKRSQSLAVLSVPNGYYPTEVVADHRAMLELCLA